MEFVVEGTLPVAIAIIDGNATLKLKKVRMATLTVRSSLALQAELKPDQYIGIGEMCAMTRLVEVDKAEDGQDIDQFTYPLDYDALMSSSSQNLHYLTNLRAELDAKEQAES